MARDLKISIRKRAVGSFFEWDRLDQAVGGREQNLGVLELISLIFVLKSYLPGTKLHQYTRKAIDKRKPALLNAIKKFNMYCETLEKLYDPQWGIPLPQPLPTELVAMRESPHLMEDVWITPSMTSVPRWLEDLDVRNGIRAMLKQERCLEERRRLGMESDNLCRWFGRELRTLQRAICTPSSMW